MFEWMSWSETEFLNKSLAAKPNSTNKILVSNSKCLNESLALKINFQRKVVLLHQIVPTKTFFRIQMFVWKTCIETNKILTAKPNWPNKSLVSNSNCLNECLEVKPNFSTKVLLLNQTPPTKSLFQIQNVWMKVLH